MKRNKKGRHSDEKLLRLIQKYPGLSQYELARKLRWSSGRVDGSVRRLLGANRVYIRVLERNGRRVNLVYPEDEKPSNRIEVPTDLLTVSNPVWDENAFFYALDNSTIGVSGCEIPEWEESSCFVEQIPIHKTEEKVVLEIPKSFWRFYDLERKHRVVSVNGNNLLITVSGYIVKEKQYPA